MITARNKTSEWMLKVGIALVLLAFGTSVASAQQKTITQICGVDQSRMGSYRALAGLSLQAFEKGEYATAATLARVLERSWDRAESSQRSPGKPHAELYNQIDSAMDDFVVPLEDSVSREGSEAKKPDPAAVRAAYNAYLEKLKQADSL